MTTTPDSPGAGGAPTDAPAPPRHDEGPRVTRDQLSDLSRLRRTAGPDRMIGGVAGGLARHFDLDPILVRVLLVVLALFGGAGLVLYLALWLFVPEEYTGRSVISTREDTRKVLLIVAAVVALICLTGATFNDSSVWPLVVVAGGALVYLLLREQRRYPDDGPHDPGTAGAASGAVSDAYGSSMTGWVGEETERREPGGQPPYGDSRTRRGYRRPSDPRRRGPILFWWVLATIALVEGCLSLGDMAGADLPGSLYPATALAIVAGGLLLGAFWGRAGGLILLGFLTLIGTGAATAADRFSDEVRYTPVTASSVRDSYQVGAGTLVLDLSQVGDPAELAGRRVEVKAGIGQIVVVVPDGVDITADAVIDGPGEARVLQQRESNIGLDISGNRDVDGEDGELEISARLHVGEIDIVTPAQYARNDYGTRK